MSLLAARTALLASRRIASSRSGVNASLQTKRRMGSGAAAPEWEGIDKVVRGYFPQDDQLATAILGGYFGLFILYKIKSAISGSPAVEEVAVAPAAVSAGSIPDVDSEEFGSFLESEENVTKLIESWEK